MRMGTFYRYNLLKRIGILNSFMKKEKVLDIGGFDGFTLSKLKALKRVLIDPDAKKYFLNIEYLKKDFFNYNFKNQKFDLILSLDVLEHIPKEKEVEYFSRIYSLLEKRGIAFITTPSKDIKTFPNFLRGFIGKKWGHYKCLGYTKEELDILIKNSGLENYKIYSYHSRYYLNTYLLIRFLQIFLPKLILEKILIKIANKDAKLDEGIS